MHETADDIDRLQRLLDETYMTSGGHLREVITPERRLDARTLARELVGMRLLVLATATSLAGDSLHGSPARFTIRIRR